MDKINVVIADDVPGHVDLIRKNFVEKTFLKDVSTVHELNFLRAHENNGSSLEGYLEAHGKQVDLLLLDLSFIDEGIESDHSTVINLVTQWQKTHQLDFFIIIVSNDGADSPQGTFKVDGGPTFPMLRKDARARTVNYILEKEYNKWVENKILKLTHSQLAILKRKILNRSEYETGNFEVESRAYALKNFFVLDRGDYQESYRRMSPLPDFDFAGWAGENGNMKFSSPVIEYFKVLRNDEEHLNLLQAQLQDLRSYLLDRCYSYLDADIQAQIPDIERIQFAAENSRFKWDTSTVKPASREAMEVFVQRLVVRRLILFLYFILEENTNDIYIALRGKNMKKSEKAIGNGLRYSYFLFKTTDAEDVASRRTTYHEILDEMVSLEEKMFLVEVGKEIQEQLKSISEEAKSDHPFSWKSVSMISRSIQK